MTKATTKAAPAQHAVAEAKYDDDLGNPFGGIALYHMLTATAEKHQQKFLDTMLEQLSEYVASECKRAVDVGGYLERIHIQYLELIKVKEDLAMLHSRILPRVLDKLSDGRHVGSERMDCAEWQKIGDKASEWQTLRDEDVTKVSWENVYLDLASTYEHVLTHCAKSHGGDPTGPASRTVRFPAGVGFMGMGVEDFEDGFDEQALGLAAQYESTFGKPATVQDCTELVENHKPLPGSARPHSFNTGKKDGQVDGKETWTPDNPQKVMKSERKNMSQWCCGQIVNGGPCGARNFDYARPTGITVKELCYECKQPKKELPTGSEGKTSVNNQPTLDAAAFEKMIEEKIASGLQQALDARQASDGSVLAGFAQDDYSIEKIIEEKIARGL